LLKLRINAAETHQTKVETQEKISTLELSDSGSEIDEDHESEMYASRFSIHIVILNNVCELSAR